MASDTKFKCTYTLDNKCDVDLVQICQETYRLVQSCFPAPFEFKIGPDGIPDAVQIWLIYYASRVYGAADAALTLVLHNLGREAVTMQRQLFEHLTSTKYFIDNPEIARLERDAEPFRDLNLMDRIGIDTKSANYLSVLRRCETVKRTKPDVYTYVQKHKDGPIDLRSMLGPQADTQTSQAYALHYRFPSQTAHATILGHRHVFSSSGVKFDSSLDDPNPFIALVSLYGLQFLEMLDGTLGLGIGTKIQDLSTRVDLFVKGYYSDSDVLESD